METYKTKKILVVGGAGYVGSVLVPRLGGKCLVVDNLLYSNEYFAAVSFKRLDVTQNNLGRVLLHHIQKAIDH